LTKEVNMSSTFATTFHWWRGTEAQFLQVMQILLSMPDNKGWMEEYHRFRIMAQLFSKLGHADPATHLLNTVKQASSKSTAASFFNWGMEVYDQRQFEINNLSVAEMRFMSDLMTLDDYNETPFDQLWSAWTASV